MRPKRKQTKQSTTAKTTPTPKRRREATTKSQEPVPTDTSYTNRNTAINVEALTAQITKTVTETVMNTLKETGLLGQTPPNAADNNAIEIQTEEHTSTRQRQQGHTANGENNKKDISSPASPSGDVDKIFSNKQKFVSPRVPLHASVSAKTKEKIWSGDFVDLSTLKDADVEELTFNIRTGAISSTVSSKKKFLSIEQWTDAFNTFASVYRLKYPAEAEGLSAYMGLIRQIADKNGSWY